MPDILGALGQFDALELAAALVVEQAKLDLLGIGGEQGEIGAPTVPACAEARSGSGGQAHGLASRFRHSYHAAEASFANVRALSFPVPRIWPRVAGR